LPFDVLTLGLCLSLVLNKPGEAKLWRNWAVIVLLGLLVGSLRWLNSWDYPPFLLLALAGIAISERHLDGGASATCKRVAAKALTLSLLSLLLFKPYMDAYQTPVAGLHPSEEQTPIHQYLAHFGAFLALIAAWLSFKLWRSFRASPLNRGLGSRSRRTWVALTTIVVFIVTLASVVLIIRGYALVGVLLPFLALVVYLSGRELRQRRPDAGARLFLLMLVALGLGLSMGVDLITLDGDIVRMNTVFKFYEHVWIVFALTASFAAWYFLFVVWQPAFTVKRRLDSVPSTAGLSGNLPKSRFLPRALAVAGAVGFVILLVAVLLYPAFATQPRLDDRFAKLSPALDGEAYMRNAFYDDEKGKIDLGADYEGIRWLRQNVKGSPAIVEGRTPLYRWGGRFSIYTGLPAVLGWDWHQTQQRGKLAFMVEQRAQAVDAFYANPDVENARRFLRQYGVAYVIVGQVERIYYPPDGIAKFDGRLGGALDLVFENNQLRIYQVNNVRLAALTR
jgi:YYY domain-containing protein